jgi:hypothetical protein
MPKLIECPIVISSVGNLPKKIDEYVGLVSTRDDSISIARMLSPPGWIEPGQTPTFREYSLVLKGVLRVEYRDGVLLVKEGQAVVMNAGEWVRYSTPEGAEYLAVCLPAFSPDSVHRDDKPNFPLMDQPPLQTNAPASALSGSR